MLARHTVPPGFALRPDCAGEWDVLLTAVNVARRPPPHRADSPANDGTEGVMRIGDVCTRSVVQIERTASIREAAECMRKRHVGSLVVVDPANGERVPVGMLTDRDIVIAVVAGGVDADRLTVADTMTHDVATCAESQDLFDAIHLMRARGVRRLPVLNDKGALTGMVSSDDLYGALSRQVQELSHALVRGQVREMETRT